MIDFASLFWFTAYGAAFLMMGLVLRQIDRWSGEASLADTFGGYRDPPWPRGVQEEEPVRFNLAAIGPRTRGRGAEPGAAVPAHSCPSPCHPPRQVARPLA